MKSLTSAVAVLIVSSAQGAVVIHVDAGNCPGPGDGSELDPYCSIQTAIDNAADTDRVVVSPGTYVESINFLGKAITLRSSGGAAVTAIDGTGNFHVVQCVNGEGADTVLDGFTITGGNARGKPGPDELGGGMRNSASSPTVMNCTFIANVARGGGGMHNSGGSPTIVNCVFSDNAVPVGDGGGGMYNSGGSALVISCRFIGNTAAHGGAMVNLGSSPTLINCLFAGNTAETAGGAVSNYFSHGPAVINCTFTGNTASQIGGAIYDGGGNSAVTNSVLWLNEPGEIFVHPKIPFTTVSYSTVQGGYTGTGNVDADPQFVDPDNGDFRLRAGSSAIDAGHNWAVPSDAADLDGDGDMSELTPFDLDGNPRFVADPADFDPGCGIPAVVDMGAYEFQIGGPFPVKLGDIDGDGAVRITDFLALLEAWGICTDECCLPDLDLDGSVGIVDFLILLASWG